MKKKVFYKYKVLDGYTYHIVSEPTTYLRKWLKDEWQKDMAEHPDQQWSQEWLDVLASSRFKLGVMNINNIKPRVDLMSYKSGEYSFQKELDERVEERLEAIEMGVSIMPLVVQSESGELMDGYTRYMALRQLGVEKVFVYVTTEV